ncbi:sporulation histidine kinase inhibitor Sda [Paenibacillus sp. CF384]|nr:sporulation histidine kinase inhibitor Sda [Paenibacillus sp. CF384]SDX22838.1 Sporulation inhibitor A [Paenibacillus sp. CF384]
MDQLSDDLLLDAYDAAHKFELDPEFILLLRAELKRRQLNPENYRNTA